MSDRSLQVRAVLDEWFGVVVVAALVVALLGGYLAYGAYAEERTGTETRTVASWESTGQFDHRATVVNDTGPFAMGSVLENRSAYFSELTPRLNGSFEYSYTASDGGNLTTDAALVLVIRSVSEGDTEESTTEYWRVEESLAEDETASLSPGETTTLSFSKNVTAAAARGDAIEARVGATPGTTDVFFEVRMSVAGTRNGQPVDQIRTYRLPVTFESGVYRVEDPGAVTNSDTRREQVTVDVAPGTLGRYGGPLLLLVGLVAAGGLVVARYRGAIELSDGERESLAHRRHRAEFEEWIHAVDLPPEAFERPEARTASLGDLVDLAIDVDAAVHEDPDGDAYYVVHDGFLYSYRVPGSDGERPSGDGHPDQRTLAEVDPATDGEGTSVDATDGDGDEPPESASIFDPEGESE
jgi:hypothetical protein